MPSDKLKTFNDDARTRKQLLSSNYDPVTLRDAIALPPQLINASKIIDLSGYSLEYRGTSGTDRVIVYVAGGGFCFPADDRHRAFLDNITGAISARALLINHRLAPEHPYPAGLNDVCNGLDFAFSDAGGARVDVIADSSGAALALSALMLRRDQSKPLPRSSVLMSPLTDLATTGLSYVTNYDADPMFGPSAIIHKAWHYLQGENPTNPQVSPLWGDVSDLCPMLLIAGSTEVMLDDAVRFADKINAVGGEATMRIVDEAPHAFPLYADLPESKDALAEIIEFLTLER